MSEYKTPADIHPCLTYADANAAIDWLCRAFGFTKRLVVPGPDGTVQHSELSLGTGVVMVSSPRPGRQPPGEAGGYTAILSVYVPDPDQHFAQAVASGATVTQPMRDEVRNRGQTTFFREKEQMSSYSDSLTNACSRRATRAADAKRYMRQDHSVSNKQ